MTGGVDLGGLWPNEQLDGAGSEEWKVGDRWLVILDVKLADPVGEAHRVRNLASTAIPALPAGTLTGSVQQTDGTSYVIARGDGCR